MYRNWLAVGFQQVFPPVGNTANGIIGISLERLRSSQLQQMAIDRVLHAEEHPQRMGGDLALAP